MAFLPYPVILLPAGNLADRSDAELADLLKEGVECEILIKNFVTDCYTRDPDVIYDLHLMRDVEKAKAVVKMLTTEFARRRAA